MNEIEDFVVKETYHANDREQQAISELQARGLVADDWNSTKAGISSFKKNIVEHMSAKQNYKCAYCRLDIPYAGFYPDREHIVPKNKHPQWVFEPRNICVSCEMCNRNKSDEEVLDNPFVSEYPTNSGEFKLVNPFVDKYSEHIELLDDLIYVGKSEKGRFTINLCKLYSIGYAIERAKRKMARVDPDSVTTQLLNLLVSNGQITDDIDKVRIKVQRLVELYKRERLI